jgi:hypothetical protein
MKVLELAKAPIASEKIVEKSRLTDVPSRVTGIYRLSVKAKEPFVVDIGARKISDVRSLEVFHTTPMYMDSIRRLGTMQVWGPPKEPVKFQMSLSGRQTAGFRITADELLPEQLQLAETVDIASLNAKLPYGGFFEHIRKIREERNPSLAYHSVYHEAKFDEMFARSLYVGAIVAMVTPFVATALGITAATPAAIVAVSADPWRTYINGRLCKNLKEVKVSLRSGEINGYMTP